MLLKAGIPTWLAILTVAACSGEKASPRSADTTVSRESHRPGIRFDPATTKTGTKIGSLVVSEIAAQRAIDSSWVGSARFNGEISLDGNLMRHPDSDVRDVCFEADSASAARMPRWAGDERRPWFCFSNSDAARKMLAADSGQVRIVVDRFTINRNLSDAVNSARLLRGAVSK